MVSDRKSDKITKIVETRDTCDRHQETMDMINKWDGIMQKKMSKISFFSTLSVCITILIVVISASFAYTSSVRAAFIKQTDEIRSTLRQHGEMLSAGVVIQGQTTKVQDRMLAQQAVINGIQNTVVATQKTVTDSVNKLESRIERYHPVIR